MFFREAAGSGGPRLYSIDLTGRNEQAIPTAQFRIRPGLVAAARVATNLPELIGQKPGFPRPRRVSAAFPPRLRGHCGDGMAATRMRGGNEILTMFLERRLTATWLLDHQ